MDAFTALIYIGLGMLVGFGAMWLYCRITHKQ